MNGFVLSWQQSDQHASGYIQGENNRRYAVAGGAVECDRIGRVYLEIGEPVSFDIGVPHTTRKGHKLEKAINVKRPFKDMSIEPSGHREFVKVVNANWVLRSLGGLLTTDDSRDENLTPGAIFECSVRQCPGIKTWQAFDLKFIGATEDEVDWAAYETPTSPELEQTRRSAAELYEQERVETERSETEAR